MEEFEYQGTWWLPQFPRRKLTGTLKFDSVNGGVLTTIEGDFSQQIAALFTQPSTTSDSPASDFRHMEIDIILGYTNKGDAATLYRCYEIQLSVTTTPRSVHRRASYKVETIFVGCHFKTSEDLVFDKLRVRFTYLEEWLGMVGPFADTKYSDDYTPLSIDVSYSYSRRIAVRLKDFDLEITPHFRAERAVTETKVQQTAFVDLTPNIATHYNTYHDFMIDLVQNFLTLGMQTAVLPLAIIAKNRKCKVGNLGRPKKRRVEMPIEIYFATNNLGLNTTRKVYRHRMLFSYPEIAAGFEEQLQNWFTKAEKLQTVLDLYFGLFYIPSMYLHLQFLSLAQALETYHRTMHAGKDKGQYMSDEEYEAVVQRVVAAIPQNVDKDHRKKLENAILYGNEYSLRKRIKLILTTVLKPYKASVDKLIGNRDEFIAEFVDTRNYLTHYTKDDDQKPITDGRGQYFLTQKVKKLVELCLLVELGLPDEAISKILSKRELESR